MKKMRTVIAILMVLLIASMSVSGTAASGKVKTYTNEKYGYSFQHPKELLYSPALVRAVPGMQRCMTIDYASESEERGHIKLGVIEYDTEEHAKEFMESGLPVISYFEVEKYRNGRFMVGIIYTRSLQNEGEAISEQVKRQTGY